MAKRKVVIFYATGGRGHVTAAKALEQSFAEHYPDVEVKNLDILDFASATYRKIFVDGYNYVSARHPRLWGRLYHGFNKEANQRWAKRISEIAIGPHLLEFLRTEKPDFIISTHPLPMQLISYGKHKDIIDIPSSMVVTDFGCHSFWVDPAVNQYFVATEEVAMCLRGYGVPVDHVEATGIPIEPKFSKVQDRAALAARFGVDPNRPCLLIVGGQFSLDDLQTLLRDVEQAHPTAQFLIVAGRDEHLKTALDSSTLGQSKNIVTFGFVENMEELMTVADVIFTKAGGLTVSECLAKGLPMVINKVIPGQEDDNVQFLVRKGAAIHVEEGMTVAAAVNKLLSDQDKLKEMRAAAAALGRPDSAKTVVDMVVDQIK
jgi:processive 1,2-diacylglycerol beta-glucosyltransferase